MSKNAREKLLDVTFEEIYMRGFAATAIDTILKKAGVPKGSLYHHFGSKKKLVLAMIQERLFPKMDSFFIFKKVDNSVYKSLNLILQQIAKNRELITYGCPMYRLIVELSPVDKDFDNLLQKEYNKIINSLTELLNQGIRSGEFSQNLNSQTFAKFILSSVWGILSLSPSISSKENFLEQSKFILEALNSYKNI
jgi:TetR/AcrR family transcriptional repressor of nem operon